MMFGLPVRMAKYPITFRCLSLMTFHPVTYNIMILLVNYHVLPPGLIYAQDQLHKKPTKAFRIDTNSRRLFVSA